MYEAWNRSFFGLIPIYHEVKFWSAVFMSEHVRGQRAVRAEDGAKLNRVQEMYTEMFQVMDTFVVPFQQTLSVKFLEPDTHFVLQIFRSNPLINR
ncbi:hypothetical protein [Alicyclobacillus tolerans]|uniref:hypothetical protein n=1 Tax=Alicyclobacillus tolerans TaxID=90970 RepID=UPI001A962E2B|nr:hypothetical protein [Alicyclobacillus montanus]